MNRDLIRKNARALIVAGVLALLASSQASAEGTVQQLSATADGYCHLKIPAMRPSTLATGTPELKSSTTGDLIDFYGACNSDPKSREQVAMQKKFRSLKYGKF
jgi:hypothetical protein